MITAFFHDERFSRDGEGVYRGTGAIPYVALARYLGHFERVVVVGRLDRPGPSTPTLVSGDGLEFACIPQGALSPLRTLPVVTARVREVLARVDAAVVRMPSLIGLVACREALRRGTPLLVEVVADAFGALWDHGSWKGRVAALPLAVLTRHYVGRAPWSVFVTREALQRRYPPRGNTAAISDVIVDPDPAVLERRLARIRARAPGGPATVGLVGSYDVGYKGHETALQALALLRRAGRPVRLRCIGAGDPARWRARALALGIADAVQLDHALPQGAAVLEWMDALDLHLTPSLREGLPRALVEAMSRGLPAVGARRGGIPELLDAGQLHPARDHRRLAALVAGLLDDPGEQLAQARRSWEVASTYARDVLASRRGAFLRRFSESVRAAAPAGAAAGAARASAYSSSWSRITSRSS